MVAAIASRRGVALPAVLSALVALSALALSLTTASRTEVVVSGAQQRAMQVLHIADAALNYSLGVPANFADPVSRPAADLRAEGLPFDATIAIDYAPPSRVPPAGIRVSALKMKAYHFRMRSEGIIAAASASQAASSTRLEMEVAKLGPAGS